MQQPKQRRFSAPPMIVRIVVDGSPSDGESKNNFADARQMLREAFSSEDWPNDKAKFVLTPGGFIHAPFPADYRGKVSWDSRPRDFRKLTEAAECAVRKTLTKSIIRSAAKKAEFLTLGVDLLHDKYGRHAELVVVVKTASGKLICRTGKSYPTTSQEHKLVQEPNLKSHLLCVAGERIWVLGCHDLKIFSARGYAAQNPEGPRSRRRSQMRELAKKFKPTIILQHPHSTDTPQIWSQEWDCARNFLPTARLCASGIAYYNDNEDCRKDIKTVRAQTKFGDGIIDVEVEGYSW
jgi:hypothetical protein